MDQPAVCRSRPSASIGASRAEAGVHFRPGGQFFGFGASRTQSGLGDEGHSRPRGFDRFGCGRPVSEPAASRVAGLGACGAIVAGMQSSPSDRVSIWSGPMSSMAWIRLFTLVWRFSPFERRTR